MYLQGKQAHESGNFELAAQTFSQMVKVEPRNALLLLCLASSLMKLHQFEPAMKHLKKAVKLKPMMPEIHCTMGSIEKTCLNDKAAIMHFERGLAISKDYPPAIYGLADIYRKLGRFDDAINLISGAIERSSVIDPHLAEAFAVVAGKAGREAEAIEHLTRAIGLDVPVTTSSSLHFRLAGVQDHIGENEMAWDTLTKANDLKVTKWDSAAYEADVDKMLEYWTRDRLASVPASGSESELPVFVVGMPRSGTSLIEQIIAAHPDGAGAGEINAMSVAASRQQRLNQHRSMVFFSDASKVTTPLLARECDEYIKSARRISEQLGDTAAKGRIVDKLPYNYQVLPLIQMMFPKARVIHTIRDPRDVCISCYFQDFLGELGYSYNLGHLAHYYAQHDRIMNRMKDVLDIPILEVRYEDLVANPEPGIRGLLDHVGLEFNEDCLNFFASKRAVHTASLDQVRKPMYTTSSQRWKRYGSKIDPLIAALNGAGVELQN
jgi:tetratricopeptide (TPR) repeat protein